MVNLEQPHGYWSEEFLRLDPTETFQIPKYLETLKPSRSATSLTEEIKAKVQKYIKLSHSRNATDRNLWIHLKRHFEGENIYFKGYFFLVKKG